MGGDWKFLAIVMGIDSARSEYACIWCKCSKEERANMDKTWSITHGARTEQENILINLLLVDLKRVDAIERLNKFNKINLIRKNTNT